MKALYSMSLLLVVGLACSVGLMAQDEKKDAPAPAKGAKAEAKKDAKAADEKKDPAAEWKELDGRKQEIMKRLPELQSNFQKTVDNEAKTKIRDEFRELIGEFQTKIMPRMVELAPEVYEKDSKNFDAGEVCVQIELQKNQIDKALKMSDKMVADGGKGPGLLYLNAVTHFAMHDFEKSKVLLQLSQKSEPLEQQAEQLLKFSEDYVSAWKEEQEIRASEEKAEGDKQNPVAEIKTNRGTIKVELFENEAPNTVANFISLIEGKKYDGTKFHRVIPGFMVQGGDPNSADDDPENDGQGGPGYTIKCEAYREDARLHFRGSLSMAHAGKDTGGSQFFITQQPTPHLNPEPKKTQSVHTVFGRVLEGMEIVDATEVGDKIESAVVVRKRKHEYKPETQAEAQPEKSLPKLKIPKLKLDGGEGKKSTEGSKSEK